MSLAYYNEIDPYAAQWLRNLISAGHIAPGIVDTRSIEDVRPEDLAGFTQCHFFAGLGGWALALELAGWPRDRPVWTGSCPCQPFSAAGKGAGFADERHLWPAWKHLITQCQPSEVFGEQVASKAAESWIDLVHADLESVGYAFGCVPFPAAGVGAPHIRDRNYWVAHACGERRNWRERPENRCFADRHDAGWVESDNGSTGADEAGLRLADANCGEFHGVPVVRGHERNWENAGREEGLGGASACGDVRRLAHAERVGFRGQGYGAPEGAPRGVQSADGQRERFWSDNRSGRTPLLDGLGHAECDRLRSGGRTSADVAHESGDWTVYANAACGPGPTNGRWADADWLRCTDGKWRAVEPGTFPLAHGVSGRVGRLRAYGNAIVPEQAAQFITAYEEARGLTLAEDQALAA